MKLVSQGQEDSYTNIIANKSMKRNGTIDESCKQFSLYVILKIATQSQFYIHYTIMSSTLYSLNSQNVRFDFFVYCMLSHGHYYFVAYPQMKMAK